MEGEDNWKLDVSQHFQTQDDTSYLWVYPREHRNFREHFAGLDALEGFGCWCTMTCQNQMEV